MRFFLKIVVFRLKTPSLWTLFGEVDVFINLQNSTLQEIFYKIFLEKLM